MYHRVRRKMSFRICALTLISYITLSLTSPIDIKKGYNIDHDGFDNDIVDFDDEYSLKFDKKLGISPWDSDTDKSSYRYNIVKNNISDSTKVHHKNQNAHKSNINTDNKSNNNIKNQNAEKTTEVNDMPIELLSTTELSLTGDAEITTDDLTVIPLSTEKLTPVITIKQTVTLPASTEISEDFNLTTGFYELTTKSYNNDTAIVISNGNVTEESEPIILNNITKVTIEKIDNRTINLVINTTDENHNVSSTTAETTTFGDSDSLDSNEEVPIFTELDSEEASHIPEDYYDSKDIVPTSVPKTDALSVIFDIAGSVVESVVDNVAERVFPKGLYDLFKRMQRQNDALEAEKLRSREENGGIGQFTRGVIKSISSGLSKPLSQLMAGVRDIGSLDSDRGFVNSLASGVTSVANSMIDVFKDRVQAIYPGTVWCGDGHAPQARSGELGLFFFTDTCCRQHDACKMYIKAGETKFGLTNTGLFTRSHCSCDARFRQCLQRTNSLVSGQIGLTYFNVLGPQCFRRAHPIVRCLRRTRITNLKCEEYELDLSKPKMWQWFDNETF